MTITVNDESPIACTLEAGDFQERLAWIADLNRDALLSRRRDGLTLELTYAPSAIARVRKMISEEQQCCAFLKFHLREGKSAIRLAISAPEHARDFLDAVFGPFEARAPGASGCGCETAGAR